MISGIELTGFQWVLLILLVFGFCHYLWLIWNKYLKNKSTKASDTLMEKPENTLEQITNDYKEDSISVSSSIPSTFAKHNVKIAIFNGLPFHFEMFGYIIYFCKLNQYDLTIYSVDDSKHGWKEIYLEMYSNLEWKDPSLFGSEYMNYDYIVLTTDDDNKFPEKLNYKNNVICIDHHYTIRRPSIDHSFHIATRPFSDNYRKWGLPCYPIVQTILEKVNMLRPAEAANTIHIAIIGGNNNYEIEQINRLSSSSKMCLHILARKVNSDLIKALNKKFILYIHENSSTSEMLEILKETKYLLCDMTRNKDHINGKSMSGSLPLAFSNLNTLILSTMNNKIYNFKSAYTFELDSNEPIELNSKVESAQIEKIYQERNSLIQSFHNHMNAIINQ